VITLHNPFLKIERICCRSSVCHLSVCVCL